MNENVAETKVKRVSIASQIDPLLFEGGHTVKEIVDLVKDKVTEKFKGKDLAMNVRVRIYTLTKQKGYTVERDGDKVKLVKTA